jgi:hypothetical protein
MPAFQENADLRAHCEPTDSLYGEHRIAQVKASGVYSKATTSVTSHALVACRAVHSCRIMLVDGDESTSRLYVATIADPG